MNNLMVKTKFVLVVLFVTVSILGLKAQKVNFKVVDDAPYSHFLNVEISPLDFRMQEGNVMVGPAIMAQIRPISRVTTEIQLASFLYTPSKGNTGLKKMGGLAVDVGAAFAWSRKGINLTANKEDKTPITGRFRLKTSGNIEKYINYPYNRLVERTIRGGGYYYDFPTEKYTTTASGFYAGLGKTVFRGATLDVEGIGQLTRSYTGGYYVDVLFGKSDFATPVDNKLSGSGIGIRFGYKMIYSGGLFPLSFTFEFGSLPGASGGMLRLKIAGNILTGKQHYKGKYKYYKKAKRKIPALIQAL
jgi:hypothetical protein